MKTTMADTRKWVGKLGQHIGKIIVILLVFAFGFLIRGLFMPAPIPDTRSTPGHEAHAGTSQEETVWTCSMHPQIRLPKSGLCPICNMELIPASKGKSEDMEDMRRLTVSDNARMLMDIETVPVERKFVTATVRAVGKVEYDETRLASITAWIPGRLDRLFVDYTGVPVQKGDHLVSLYSPQLLTAQEELLQALEAVKNINDSNLSIMRETAGATVTASRDKLRLWGLTAGQIDEIEKSGKVSDHMTIYAPVGGIVVHKNALEGMYVQEGTRIYTIADLSQLWVKLDAYESDLEWLRYGQKVEFTTVAHPGKVFTGTIAFIDPILNERTRTVKVRVNVPNSQGQLKPGMFVKAVIQANVAGGGRIMDADLAGKWICPMHPDVIKDRAGTCDICEMPLATTDSLGYASDDPASAEKPLVIPVSAAMVTGMRAIVYVQLPGEEKLTFEGREIVLGPRAGDYYLVRSGLQEGERVVVKGNFKLDAELQIQAKPSMMTPDSGVKAPKPPESPVSAVQQKHELESPKTRPGPAISKVLQNQLAEVFKGYFSIQSALADDNAVAAQGGVQQMHKALQAVDMKLFSPDTHHAWMKASQNLEKILVKTSKTEAIQALREQFYLLSQQMIAVSKDLGFVTGNAFYVMHCPMAFDNRGADWLQDRDDLANPYFGAMMLKCGSIDEIIPNTEVK